MLKRRSPDEFGVSLLQASFISVVRGTLPRGVYSAMVEMAEQ